MRVAKKMHSRLFRSRSFLIHSSPQYRLLCSFPAPQNLKFKIPPLSRKMSSTTTPDPSSLSSTAQSSKTGTAATSQSDLSMSEPQSYIPRYIDIGINLTDRQYRGEYHGKKAHATDLEDVIQRAKDAGCKKLMVTGSDMKGSQEALEIAEQHPSFIFSTVGVHPCNVKSFDAYPTGPIAYISALRTLATTGKSHGHVAAFGEIGLDYDRLYHASVEEQKKYFALQLDLAEELGLPLFLHSRAAAEDFEAMLFPRLPKLKGGVVHSFTGTLEEMERIMKAGLYVGVNGCSLKTEENLAVVKEIPLDRLMLETDGPWCEIRPSHASSKYLKDAPALPKSVKKERFLAGTNQLVKGRNEPCTIPHVAHVVANLKGLTVEEVCEAAWSNTVNVFGLGENNRSMEGTRGG